MLLLLVSTFLSAFLGLVTAIPAPKTDPKTPTTTGSACFIKGTLPLPEKGVADPSIQCVDAIEKLMKAVSRSIYLQDKLVLFNLVPDVMIGNIKFTDIFYEKEKNISAVGFALKTFKISTPATAEETEFITTCSRLYTAVNQGLRSIGTPATKVALGSLKGVDFFLAMQLATINCTPAPQDAKHKQAKVLKNCPKCTDAEKEAVSKLA